VVNLKSHFKVDQEKVRVIQLDLKKDFTGSHVSFNLNEDYKHFENTVKVGVDHYNQNNHASNGE